MPRNRNPRKRPHHISPDRSLHIAIGGPSRATTITFKPQDDVIKELDFHCRKAEKILWIYKYEGNSILRLTLGESESFESTETYEGSLKLCSLWGPVNPSKMPKIQVQVQDRCSYIITGYVCELVAQSTIKVTLVDFPIQYDKMAMQGLESPMLTSSEGGNFAVMVTPDRYPVCRLLTVEVGQDAFAKILSHCEKQCGKYKIHMAQGYVSSFTRSRRQSSKGTKTYKGNYMVHKIFGTVSSTEQEGKKILKAFLNIELKEEHKPDTVKGLVAGRIMAATDVIVAVEGPV